MRPVPEALLAAHDVSLSKRELSWQQVLRLNQALWREEQGLPMAAGGPSRGSRLDASEAERSGANLMSAAARLLAERELAAKESTGKVIDRDRLRQNLLTSQALCFTLFGELRANLDLASVVVSRMLGREVRVTRLEVEYSPGRGDPAYTADKSAADAYVEYEIDGSSGFLAIEVKYHEDLVPPEDWRDTYRPRYAEVTAQMACFADGAIDALRKPPLEQLWRDHLLAGAILHHVDSPFDEGRFVLLAPKLNRACSEAVEAYSRHLTTTDSFSAWSLEEVLSALEGVADDAWLAAVRERYVVFDRVSQVWQAHYLQELTRWATLVRQELGAVQIQNGQRVHFRPSSSGFAMVGLLPDKPQLGKSYQSASALLADFEAEFAKHCDGDAPDRPTPEKVLQSALVADALSHGRSMNLLNEAAGRAGHVGELVFLTDELVLPTVEGDQRLDILALRCADDGNHIVVIELKSIRAMTELLRQTATYGAILDRHMDDLGRLAEAILGRQVALAGATEKWIVWPAVGGEGPDPRVREFREQGVTVVGYAWADRGLVLRVGGPVG